MEDIFVKKDCFKEWYGVESILKVGNCQDCPHPVVSVLIPCFKRPDMLRMAIQSALQQDFNEEYEIVVVDDNPVGDKSPCQSVVEEFGAKNLFYYRNEKNMGVTANWNRCVELARAEDLTFCHDDDMLLPNCLTRLMAIRRSNPDKIVLSMWNYIDGNGNFTFHKTSFRRKKLFPFIVEKESYSYSLMDQFFNPIGIVCGCLYSRRCFMELGGYDNQYYPCMDQALHSKYLYYYGAVLNSMPAYNYRMWDLNIYKTDSGFNITQSHFLDCILPKLWLPSWLLMPFVRSQRRVLDIQERANATGDLSIAGTISFKDKIIRYLYSYFTKQIKPFRISFKK